MSLSIQYLGVFIWAALWAGLHGWQLKRWGRGPVGPATPTDRRAFHLAALAFCLVNGAQALVKGLTLAPPVDLALHVQRLMMNAAIMAGVGVLALGVGRFSRTKPRAALTALGLHSAAMAGVDVLFWVLFQG